MADRPAALVCGNDQNQDSGNESQQKSKTVNLWTMFIGAVVFVLVFTFQLKLLTITLETRCVIKLLKASLINTNNNKRMRPRGASG